MFPRGRAAAPRALLLLLLSRTLLANPATPSIVEPENDGQLVSGADVHMVTAAFDDPDGHGHLCTDWQIHADSEVVWESPCATGAEKIHIHLGDGAFTGSLAGRNELPGKIDYRLSARHRNDSGDPAAEWSEWAERTFRTSLPLHTPPLAIRDVLTSPAPQWTASPGPGATLRLETSDGEPLLEIGTNGTFDAEALPSRSYVRVVLTAGASEWDLPESELSFEDVNGTPRRIYIPALGLGAGMKTELWVSANGGTHHAEPGARTPDFTTILRGAPVPWTVRQRGFVVEPVADGLQLPVNIAFVPEPASGPDAPLFYVVELYGAVKVVTRGGEVHPFADDLLDAMPTGHFPGDGETGLAGIAVDPSSGDVFVTGIYWPDREATYPEPRILRLRPSVDGLHATAVETVVAFRNEPQTPSHQISNISFGPDGYLYVHVGDAIQPENAQDLDTVRGKILRIGTDGSPPADNPFYDESDGIDATDFIYALGFRNPFGGAWNASDRSLYCVENGPTTDRLTRVTAGQNYLWDGTNDSMNNFALHVWESAAPVQIAFVQPETFGGSGFPQEKLRSAFVTESGPTWASGAQVAGKRITEVILHGDDAASTSALIEYNGTGKATTAGLAAGPDGLYFTDLYRDFGYTRAIDRGARVFRVRWAGYAAFRSEASAFARRVVTFFDESAVAGATAWTWDFGDGTFSSERNPRHEYPADGIYLVRLAVTGSGGTFRETKKMWAGASFQSLTAEYFGDPDFQTPVLQREEREVTLPWGDGPQDFPIPPEGFSARWTGTVRPRFSETYRFTVRTEGQVRVKVKGTLVVDRWNGPHDDDRTSVIDLEAGREYPVVVEYRNATGKASLEVLWESASQPVLRVPQSYSASRRRAVRH